MTKPVGRADDRRALLLASTACTSEPPEPPRFAITDSAGMLIAESSSPALGGDAMWRIAENATLEVGRQVGEEEHLLSGIVGASRLDDGSLVLCN
jgi:hypothetical protein